MHLFIRSYKWPSACSTARCLFHRVYSTWESESEARVNLTDGWMTLIEFEWSWEDLGEFWVKLDEFERVRVNFCVKWGICERCSLKTHSTSLNVIQHSLKFTQSYSTFTQTHSMFAPKFPLWVYLMKQHLAEKTLSHVYDTYMNVNVYIYIYT